MKKSIVLLLSFFVTGCVSYNASVPTLPKKAEKPEVVKPPLQNSQKQTTVARDEKKTVIFEPKKVCKKKGRVVKGVGVSVKKGFCESIPSRLGIDLRLSEGKEPSISNVQVLDSCNILVCFTSEHYDHFGLSKGQKNIHIQINWKNNKPVIY